MRCENVRNGLDTLLPKIQFSTRFLIDAFRQMAFYLFIEESDQLGEYLQGRASLPLKEIMEVVSATSEFGGSRLS